MNTQVENYHASSMPALRTEQVAAPSPFRSRIMPENHKYPQAFVYQNLQDLSFQLAKVDPSENGRAAAENLLSILNEWNLQYQLNRLGQ